MQTTSNKSSSFSHKKITTTMMDTPHHHHHHHHHHNHDDNNDDDEPTLLSASGGFGEEHGCVGGDACSGPLLSTTTTTNNHHQAHVVASMSDIYDVVGSTDFMPLPCSAETLISHNSSGVMVNANVRGVVVPNFTAAQRQELERQTMIYKYMMASVPVPPQLLIPISKTTPNFPHLHSNTRSKGSLELGVPNTSDPEPWRCRRTDGKKWRCSRNVVPDQKYCERHSHKSRPRSRKPVEQLHSHFFTTTTTTTTNNNNNNNGNNNTTLSYLKSSGLLNQREKHPSLYSSTSHDQTRGLEWFMKGEEANSSNQQGSFFTRPQSERAFDFYNNNNYQSLQSQGLNEQFSSLIDPKLVPGQTRHFIDAWSTNDKVLPYSSLSLSMQGGNNGTTSEDSENSQMGFGVEGDNLKSQIWLNNTISWNGSISTSPQQPQPQPGGPLAEALCLGMAGSARPTTTSSRSSS
ncbi:growth-regulating factor 8 isoform X2 [Morus notabilis]|nr:growth-regulating factor 8 isoform X2 [Morus notabilis]